MDSSELRIGIVLYPAFTQLDATGPYEVFARIPQAQTVIVAATSDPVESDTGLRILPDLTFASAPQFDILCVSGGPGQVDQMENEEILGFLRKQAAEAVFVTSVCTGALILGAAGLLDGRRATTHWSSLDQLAEFGAEPVKERVVVDDRLVTSAGVTAGIDLAIVVTAAFVGDDTARAIQLGLEYEPSPPFGSGSPDRAPEFITNFVRNLMHADWKRRAEKSARVGARLKMEKSD